MTTRLHEYGEPLVAYAGRGRLFFAADKTQDVAFDAGQFPNGETLIACTTVDPKAMERFLMSWGGSEPEEPVKFEGATDSGVRLEGHDLQSINYLPEMNMAGTYDALRVGRLIASFPCSEPAAEYRFGLVNFHVNGTRHVTVKRERLEHHVHGTPIQVAAGGRVIGGAIVPTAHADRVHRRVITRKSHGVMAEAIFPADVGVDFDALTGRG